MNSVPTRPAQRWASSATARSKSRSPARVGGGDLRRGLVGGEHDPPPPATEEGRDPVGSVVTGSPNSEVCATNSSSPATRLVRADGEVVERCGVGAPLAQGLREQRQRRDQNQRPPGVEPLGDPHRRQRLAGSAGHDQLPAVGALEALDRRPDRLLDVRERLLRARAAGAQIVRATRATPPAQARAASGAGSPTGSRWSSRVRLAVGPRWSVVAISSR